MNFTVADFLRGDLAQGDELVLDEIGARATPRKGVSMVLFSCHGSLFSVPSASVVAVIPAFDTTHIPFIRGRFCCGFIAHDGNAIPVTNLSLLTGCAGFTQAEPCRQLIILESISFRTALQATAVRGVGELFFEDDSSRIHGRIAVRQGWSIENELVAALDPEEITSSLQEHTS